MFDDISPGKMESFDKISKELDQILKNADYLTKKSKTKESYYDGFGHDERAEMCTGITYQLDKNTVECKNVEKYS